MTLINQPIRRPRKRKPTLTPRFNSSSIAYEIGLIRISMEMVKDIEKEERESNK